MSTPGQQPTNNDPVHVNAAPGGDSENVIGFKALMNQSPIVPFPNLPTGVGAYYAQYQPAHDRLLILVYCTFDFLPGGRIEVVTSADGAPEARMNYTTPWPKGEPEKWKATFL